MASLARFTVTYQAGAVLMVVGDSGNRSGFLLERVSVGCGVTCDVFLQLRT